MTDDLNKFGRGLLDAGSFGYDDEAKAALTSLFDNHFRSLKGYDDWLNHYRADKKSQEGPAFMGGQIAGNIGTSTVLPAIKGSKIAATALSGLLTGSGESDGDILDRISSGGLGAATGIVGGAIGQKLEELGGLSGIKKILEGPEAKALRDYLSNLGVPLEQVDQAVKSTIKRDIVPEVNTNNPELDKYANLLTGFERDERIGNPRIPYRNLKDKSELYSGHIISPTEATIHRAYAGESMGQGQTANKLTGLLVREGAEYPEQLKVDTIIELNTLKQLAKQVPPNDTLWGHVMSKMANNVGGKLGKIELEAPKFNDDLSQALVYHDVNDIPGILHYMKTHNPLMLRNGGRDIFSGVNYNAKVHYPEESFDPKATVGYLNDYLQTGNKGTPPSRVPGLLENAPDQETIDYLKRYMPSMLNRE